MKVHDPASAVPVSPSPGLKDSPPGPIPCAKLDALASRSSTWGHLRTALLVGGLLALVGALTGFAVLEVRADSLDQRLASIAQSPPPADDADALLTAPVDEVVDEVLAPAPASAAPSLPAAACPTLTQVDPPWLVVGPPGPAVAALPDVPRSLERRVAFWTKVWGERGDNQHFLVDDRYPWVIHAEVDCRDLFAAHPPEIAKKDCGARLTKSRNEVRAKLKRNAKRPWLRRQFGGSRSMAKDAHQHMIAIQGRKDALERAKARAQPHLGHAEGLFAVENVPRIYARAAIVESLWRPEAMSRSGASGVFQFMPATGRQFLAVEDGVVDERLDPLRSSWAAARYMSHMAKSLKRKWPLVLTAYNTGPSRMRRVMKARRTEDLGRIANAGTWGEFGFDGQNYYAQIVAIGRLTRDATFEPKPILGRAVRVDKPLPFAELARCTEAHPETLAEANPALAKAVVAGDKLVPAGYIAHIPDDPLTTAAR